jgi:myo-inositol-1(or 4)-monophosphatase
MTPAQVDELLDLAVATAREAGALLQRFADGRDLDVATKSSATDPVSDADHASERLIVERLLTARPDDGLLAEEDTGNRSSTSGLTWVVDPLDGTVNYLYGIPQWCVSIAVEDQDGPLVGVVFDPPKDELFSAARGQGARLNGERIAASAVSDLGDTLVATGFAYEPPIRSDQAAVAAAMVRELRDLRRAGAAALDLAWVAAGRLDAYYEGNLKPWDWSAGRLLVEEAGGRTTPCEVELAGSWRPALVASGVAVHDALVSWARGHGARLS